MRWNEQQVQPEKKKPKKEKEEPRILAGSKDYDYYNLANTKKVLTGRGKV